MIKFQGSPDRKALSTLCNNTSNIPVSPTANLKLLTKVASELATPVASAKALYGNVLLRETDSKTRKDKSLGILCNRFLAMFPLNLPAGYQVMEICLDQVAEQLGIVKRRIYDIINILESLQMASKVAKNRYHWHGCNNLQATLSQLKVMALECGIDEKLQDVQAKQKSGFRLVSGPTCCCINKSPLYSDCNLRTSSNLDEGRLHSRSGDAFFSDERTLGVMCLKFIMLFLASPQSNAKINLDLATRMLVSEAADATERHLWGMQVECHQDIGDRPCEIGSKACKCMLRLKTKVRRLYDIANVLTSLGLITKIETPTNSMRKPVFTYTGPLVSIKPGQSTQSFSFKNFVAATLYEEDEGVENKVIVSHKRKDLKFKGEPSEKFPRISSDSNLDGSLGQFATSYNLPARHILMSSAHTESNSSKYQCSLDDILQVAGQELEKLRSSEELAAIQKISSARKKLSFSRSHSESCIKTSAVESGKSDKEGTNQSICNENTAVAKSITATTEKKNVCITLSDTKSKCFTITRKLVEVPVHALPRKVTTESSINFQNITPMQAQTLSTLFGLPDQEAWRGTTIKSAKILSTTGADLINNNKSVVPNVPNLLMNTSKRAGISCSNASAATSAVTQGELYRAIKVGKVVRLVPFIMKKKNL